MTVSDQFSFCLTHAFIEIHDVESTYVVLVYCTAHAQQSGSSWQHEGSVLCNVL